MLLTSRFPAALRDVGAALSSKGTSLSAGCGSGDTVLSASHLSRSAVRSCSGDAVEGAVRASLKARSSERTRWFGMSVVLSSKAPVLGEVLLVRSHSVMAARS